MNILFHENYINERGTSVALYDYALYNEILLNNKSFVITKKTNNHNINSLSKFKKRFNVYEYNTTEELHDIALQLNIDLFYVIKSGENDGVLLSNAKNAVHSVFNNLVQHIHGDKYATVSEWLSLNSDGIIPFVPHMVNLPEFGENFRQELNISEHATVIGRYGGLETFDIPFLAKSINDALNDRTDLYFVLMNTNPFLFHERVIYLNGTSCEYVKTKFINTTDAMIHARLQGESFGLSVLEFASKNKQIITYGLSPEKSHLMYLNNNCHIYNNDKELTNILKNINKINPFDTSYLCEDFSPKNVMNKFKQIFID